MRKTLRNHNNLRISNSYVRHFVTITTLGLATVAWHKQDDDERAANYDALLLAQEKAKKVGLFFSAINLENVFLTNAVSLLKHHSTYLYKT